MIAKPLTWLSNLTAYHRNNAGGALYNSPISATNQGVVNQHISNKSGCGESTYINNTYGVRGCNYDL